MPGREPTTNLQMTPGPGIKPGLQWWMTKALTTAPALLPSTEIESEIWEQANDEQNQPARQVATEETNNVLLTYQAPKLWRNYDASRDEKYQRENGIHCRPEF